MFSLCHLYFQQLSEVVHWSRPLGLASSSVICVTSLSLTLAIKGSFTTFHSFTTFISSLACQKSFTARQKIFLRTVTVVLFLYSCMTVGSFRSETNGIQAQGQRVQRGQRGQRGQRDQRGQRWPGSSHFFPFFAFFKTARQRSTAVKAREKVL